MKLAKTFLAIAALLLMGTSFAGEEKVGVMSQYPSVSPSNLELAFSADFDGVSRIWTSHLNGTGLRKVTDASTSPGSIADVEPAWSPDGRQIAYSVLSGSRSDIWVVGLQGGYASRLTSNAASNSHPVWSPDGRRIVFVSDKDGTRDIWIMNADGSQQTKLVGTSAEDDGPSFSPAGDRLVFAKTENSASMLMVVNVDGTGLRPLTSGNYRDGDSSWGPRGIVFSSSRDTSSEHWKLWIVQADGSNLRRLSDFPALESAWLPDGRIVFTDETMASRAIGAVSIFDPATGSKQVVVDVQGYLTPIDIRPGKTSNNINPKSQGKVRVAILSRREFDATKLVVQQSITFGKTGAESSLVGCDKQARDANGDGLPDLICRFNTRFAGFQNGDSAGILRFLDTSGKPYEGRDTVTTVATDDPEDFKE